VAEEESVATSQGHDQNENQANQREQSDNAIVKEVNKTTKGWFEYFKHSHKTTFNPLDGWIRERLRAILRKRHKGKKRIRMSDHWRWPNAYFTNHGLFSLEHAHRLTCHSLKRATH
jgi:RNA-directed DNA polymerase